MFIGSFIHSIHWIAALAMTILSFVIGFLWHQPILFGRVWTKENYGDSKVKVNPAMVFGGTAVLHFILFAFLSGIVSEKGWLAGLMTGFAAAIFFVLPAMGGTYLFANRPLKLLAIDAGMYIVLMSIGGAVLGIW